MQDVCTQGPLFIRQGHSVKFRQFNSFSLPLSLLKMLQKYILLLIEFLSMTEKEKHTQSNSKSKYLNLHKQR